MRWKTRLSERIPVPRWVLAALLIVFIFVDLVLVLLVLSTLETPGAPTPTYTATPAASPAETTEAFTGGMIWTPIPPS